MRPQPQNARRALLLLSAFALGLFVPGMDSAGQRDRGRSSETSPAIQKTISEAAKKYGIPGIAVAQIENGRVGAVEVFGVRDRKSGAPITVNTIFEAGSLGEPLYAYAVLLLSAEGRLNSGAPLPSYLPLPYVRNMDPTSPASATESLYDPQFNQITAIRVMSHSTGMPDWARSQHLALQFPPGQKWSYSNEGYLYLQSVVEHVTGEATDDLLRRSVLGPARMTHSGFVWRDAYTSEMATGYDVSGMPVELHEYLRPAAAASLYTSIRDYAQFIAYLLASAPAQRAHESAVTLMLNPAIPVNDAVPFSWGLGVGLEKGVDDLYFFQRGTGSGFQSFMIASRKTGNGVVILTNSGNGLRAVPDIVTAIVGGNHPVLKSTFVNSK